MLNQQQPQQQSKTEERVMIGGRNDFPASTTAAPAAEVDIPIASIPSRTDELGQRAFR